MQLGLQWQPVRKSQASGMPLGRPLRVGVGGAEDVFVAPHQGKHAALPVRGKLLFMLLMLSLPQGNQPLSNTIVLKGICNLDQVAGFRKYSRSAYP